MKITLIDAGKRFNRDWIFRHLSYEFHTGHSYAITGPNGSGKSTLLQVIGGAVGPSEGRVNYEKAADVVPPEDVYKYISLAAPYLELIEEMTLPEFLDFHSAFKPFISPLDTGSIVSLLGLDGAKHKQIRNYSSGMKQRVKLAQSIFSDTPVVLLDEPCTNLDEDGVLLYQRLIKNHCIDRLVIVSSNDRQEYEFCTERINIVDYK
jgi:ABC-type multidrug transport system ATPase subunit